MRALAVAGLLLLCAPVTAQAQDPAPAVVAEAEEFMRTYASDLLGGRRAAIGARYDRRGAYLVGEGAKRFAPYDSIVALYASARWSPPVSFEWQDLSYEAVGRDAVVVVGKLLWGFASDKPPIAVSYTALLRRQDGQLRIRVEDESAAPPPRAAP